MKNSLKLKNNLEPNEFLNKKSSSHRSIKWHRIKCFLFFLNCGARVIMAGRDIKTMKKICEKLNFKNVIIMKLELKYDINI